jgi:CO dehydrogenase maturation factor
VGKTTVAACLARAWQASGCRVVAVDADPDANLAGTLGYRGEEITPLVALHKLIEERVGGTESWGGFLKMNPRVDDIPDRFGVDVEGIRVLVMGTVERGRQGCACPENVLLREVLNHLLLSEDEHVVVDMEAGLEHFGRGTAEGVNAVLVVVEPGWAALQTATRIAKLTRDLGIDRLQVVANKVAGNGDLAYVRDNLGDLPLAGVLPVDREIEQEARSGRVGPRRPFHQEMERIARELGRC